MQNTAVSVTWKMMATTWVSLRIGILPSVDSEVAPGLPEEPSSVRLVKKHVPDLLVKDPRDPESQAETRIVSAYFDSADRLPLTPT